MKKSLIAVAGASLAAAAMPVVGVFAVDSQVVDTVKVTISDSCTIINNNDSATPSAPGEPGTSTSVENGTQVVRNTYAVAMALGQLKSGIGGPGAENGSANTPSGDPSQNGGSVSIVCNGSVTPSIDDPTQDPYTPSTGVGSWKLTAVAANEARMIGAADPSLSISTGTATSGATSNWAFKIEATDYTGTYAEYSAIPESATEIIRGKGAFTFKPRYQVYVGTSQAADTYTGTVTYTLTAPAA